MRILVTGAAGYIGPVLVLRLRAAGHEVVGLDAGFFSGCEIDPRSEQVAYQRRDVRDAQPADFEGFEAVIHLAGMSNDPLGDLDPDLTYEINAWGTQRVAEAARAAGVRRFVFASSCSVYGPGDGDNEVREGDPVVPLTPYAKSKLMAESALSKLASRSFACVSLRAATVFGPSPKTRLDLVLNELTAAAVTGQALFLNSSGTAWRPFIYIDDLCDAYLSVVEAETLADWAAVYNVGSERSTSQVIRAAEVISRVTGADLSVRQDAQNDPRNYRVNFDTFANTYGWSATHSLEDGVRLLAEHLRACGIEADALTASRFRRLPSLLDLKRTGVLGPDLRFKI